MKCKKCEAELTRDPVRKCLVCLECSPPQATKPKPAKKSKGNYVDVPWTEERIREIIRDELADWSKALTREQIREIVQDELTKPPLLSLDSETGKVERVPLREPDNPPTEDLIKPDWREQAKALDIKLFHKTKVQVLAEIAEKMKKSA